MDRFIDSRERSNFFLSPLYIVTDTSKFVTFYKFGVIFDVVYNRHVYTFFLVTMSRCCI